MTACLIVVSSLCVFYVCVTFVFQAAEALGAIGGNEAEGLLRTFMADDVVAVKESCEVALDTIDYWSNRG